jgi:hypothetical protein
MKRIIAAIVILSFVLFISGCATDASQAEKGAGIGALIGGVGAGLTTLAVTGDAKKALIATAAGAVVGGLTGFIIGRYRDKQTKTAQQIYKENPEYAEPVNAAMPPVIMNLRPYIADMNGKPVNAIKGGQEVDLAMKYDIVIPQHSNIKEVEVVEYNTLISPDGKKSMDIEKLKRTQIRKIGGIDAGKAVKVPKGLPSGKYTHVAGVLVGDKKYEQIQPIQVAGIYDANKMYASNSR